MELKIKLLSVLLVISPTFAQYEGFHGYEGHQVENYHAKQPSVHHQSLNDHDIGEEYDVDYHAHPKYTFDYSVKDPQTGDDKQHWETRDGDKVKGSYTLLETDGTKRVVEYEADDKNGFNAVVHKIGKPIEHEEIEYKPVNVHTPLFDPTPEYQHNYQFDEGFVPIADDYEH